MQHRPISVAGLDVSTWVDLFEGCHTNGLGGAQQFAWPDGKCYLDQYNVTVNMFGMIRKQLEKVSKS